MLFYQVTGLTSEFEPCDDEYAWVWNLDFYFITSIQDQQFS